MNKKIFWLLVPIFIALGIWWFIDSKQVILSPSAPWLFREKPLQKYSFPELSQRLFVPDGIWVEGDKFYFWVDGKRIALSVF